MLAEASARYPDEACGLVLEGRGGAVRFVAIPNIAGSRAAAETSARTGRDGYVMEPARLLAELSAAEDEGGGLRAIVHSHPDAGAYFSKEDRDMALAGGPEPLWQGVDYLVISCRAGTCEDAKLYRWNVGRGDFDETQLGLINSALPQGVVRGGA